MAKKIKERTTKVIRGINSIIVAQQRTQVNSITLQENEDLAYLLYDKHGDVDLFLLRDKTKENKIVIVGTDDEKLLVDFTSNSEIDKKDSELRILHDTTKENLLDNKNERLLSIVSKAKDYELDKTEIEVLEDEWKENTLVNKNKELLKITYSEPDELGRVYTNIEVLRDKLLIEEVERINQELIKFISETNDNFILVNERIDKTDKNLEDFKNDTSEKFEIIETKISDVEKDLNSQIQEVITSINQNRDDFDKHVEEQTQKNDEYDFFKTNQLATNENLVQADKDNQEAINLNKNNLEEFQEAQGFKNEELSKQVANVTEETQNIKNSLPSVLVTDVGIRAIQNDSVMVELSSFSFEPEVVKDGKLILSFVDEVNNYTKLSESKIEFESGYDSSQLDLSHHLIPEENKSQVWYTVNLQIKVGTKVIGEVYREIRNLSIMATNPPQ